MEDTPHFATSRRQVWNEELKGEQAGTTADRFADEQLSSLHKSGRRSDLDKSVTVLRNSCIIIRLLGMVDAQAFLGRSVEATVNDTQTS